MDRQTFVNGNEIIDYWGYLKSVSYRNRFDFAIFPTVDRSQNVELFLRENQKKKTRKFAGRLAGVRDMSHYNATQFYSCGNYSVIYFAVFCCRFRSIGMILGSSHWLSAT